ncbi:family 43 glycosylhydrolase [Ruminococcus sp. HUN007]|uniref:beta-xylosidase family glycoside hydrolase n=1 Tax=Ruminococcus sp. HUN007 TaxID=1514668 RepID=UPI000678A838|nr:family 43 glycosylhydrolase [Ruminococcus sp. HUN007]
MCKVKKSVKTTAALLSAAAVLTSAVALPGSNRPDMTASVLAAGQIANPVIWADVPDDDIIRVGDTYYMVSTTMYFSPGAPIMKSKDLANWEICNYVFDTYANGDVQNLKNGKHDYSHGQWATSLRYNEKKKKYYAFFGSYGSGKSYICSTDDIENGEWSRVELNGMYHDASMLFDDDGRNYLVYGAGGTCNIKEFNSDMTGWAQGAQERRLFKTNFNNLAGEGWHIHKIKGYYYILGIAWPSGHGRLEFCYRSKSLTGNWENKTLLDSGLGSYGSGCAQGGIVDTPDGKWYALLFQDHGSVGRIPVLVPVTWQNDWPMMGVNGKAPLTLDLSASKGTDVAGDDSFDYSSNDLALEWSWNHNPDNTAWSVTERPGWLRLKNKNMASHLLNARNTLTMRTEGPACSSYIKLDATNMKPGDYAGLSAFQLKYGCIGVRVDDSGNKKVYMSVNGGSDVAGTSNKIVAEQNMSGNEVYLKVDFKFANVNSDGSSSNNIDKANFYYSFDGQNWNKLGQELSMSYDLKLFTGYRSGIYSYPTKSTGGYADIDFFEYERQMWNGCDGSKALSGSPVVLEPDENGYWFHDTFEDGTNSWSGRGAAQVSSSASSHQAGSKALSISGRESSWNGAQKVLNRSVFKAGEEYAFSACFNAPEADEPVEYKLTLQYTDASGETKYDKVAQEFGNPGEYVQLYNPSYKIPDGASNAYLIAETIDGTMDFFIDEAVGAVAGTAITGPKSDVKPATTVKGDLDMDGKVTIADLAALKSGVLNGFTNKSAQKNGDVDNSSKTDASDALNLQKYLLGVITSFPDNTPAAPAQSEPVQNAPAKSAYAYNANLQYKAAPDSYFKQPANHGTVVKENYTGINGNKNMYVYLPYGYDKSKKYNVFYLMHGGGESEETCFNDNNINIDIMLDNMIANGDIEPMIVVTPTFNKAPSADGVWEEMRKSIIPYVEGKYSTYAENTNIDGLKASRYHRAYGGFSMGGGSTWANFNNNLDIIAYFMPLSGHCWDGAGKVINAAKNSGFKKNEYFVLAATGTEDIAYGNMVPMINELKKNTDVFTYTADFSKGNLFFLEAKGNVHWWPQVRHYIYDALPYFFHENQ